NRHSGSRARSAFIEGKTVHRDDAIVPVYCFLIVEYHIRCVFFCDGFSFLQILFHLAEIDFCADSMLMADFDDTIFCSEFLRSDVLIQVSYEGCCARRQSVVAGGSDGDVVEMSETCFQYAVAPEWNMVLFGEVMDFLRLGQSADTSVFHVDDTA